MNSKGILFISGGGRAPDTKLLDSHFVSTLKNRKVLYIPVGLQRSFVGYDECYEWITGALNPYSEKPLDIEMWVDLNHKSYSDLPETDAIYIGGGKNSYLLMKQFKGTGFFNILKTFLDTGGYLYGGSTGAIILGKFVSVFGEVPPEDLMSDDGLGLVGDFSIFCHYNLEREPKILDFLKNKKSPVIAIPENSGVVIKNATLTVKGFSPITLFMSEDVRILVNPDSIWYFEEPL